MMVRTPSDTRIEFGSSGSENMFFKKISDYKDTSALEQITKKTFSLRRFFFPSKGRQKGKNVDTANKPYLADELVHKRIHSVDDDLENMAESPQGLDYNEWLATHTISFFEHLNLVFGAVSEYCTSTGCSAMSGPNNMQYLWVDPKGKKCKCAAPQYVDYVMSNSQQTINDETVFPTRYGNTFPDTFETTVRKIHTWLFHVLAHIYHAHYKEILQLSLHSHLNTVFLHFSVFNKRHRLVEEKETEVLEELFLKLKSPGTPPPAPTSSKDSSSREPSPQPEVADGAKGDQSSPMHTAAGTTTTQQAMTDVEDSKRNGSTGSDPLRTASVENNSGGGEEMKLSSNDLPLTDQSVDGQTISPDNKENMHHTAQAQAHQANGQPRNPST